MLLFYLDILLLFYFISLFNPVCFNLVLHCTYIFIKVKSSYHIYTPHRSVITCILTSSVSFIKLASTCLCFNALVVSHQSLVILISFPSCSLFFFFYFFLCLSVLLSSAFQYSRRWYSCCIMILKLFMFTTDLCCTFFVFSRVCHLPVLFSFPCPPFVFSLSFPCLLTDLFISSLCRLPVLLVLFSCPFPVISLSYPCRILFLSLLFHCPHPVSSLSSSCCLPVLSLAYYSVIFLSGVFYTTVVSVPTFLLVSSLLFIYLLVHNPVSFNVPAPLFSHNVFPLSPLLFLAPDRNSITRRVMQSAFRFNCQHSGQIQQFLVLFSFC